MGFIVSAIKGLIILAIVTLGAGYFWDKIKPQTSGIINNSRYVEAGYSDGDVKVQFKDGSYVSFSPESGWCALNRVASSSLQEPPCNIGGPKLNIRAVDGDVITCNGVQEQNVSFGAISVGRMCDIAVKADEYGQGQVGIANGVVLSFSKDFFRSGHVISITFAVEDDKNVSIVMDSDLWNSRQSEIITMLQKIYYKGSAQ